MLRILPSWACYPCSVSARIAAIGVSHWHSLYDSAYLRHLAAIPDTKLVALQDTSAAIAAQRAAELGDPAVYTDYRRMLTDVKPDFVIALGRHSSMAETALYLLDQGYPFLMEKPMGVDADEVRRVAERAAAKHAFVAVPLGQRYQPCVARARSLSAEARFGPLSHIYFRLNRPTSARYVAWDAPWMLDPRDAGGGCLRNLGPHGLDLFPFLTGEDAQVTGAQISARALDRAVEDYASVLLRSASGCAEGSGVRRLVGSPAARREERGRQVPELRLGAPEPVLEDGPHRWRGGAPGRGTRDGVRRADLRAHRVHRLVRLLLRGDV